MSFTSQTLHCWHVWASSHTHMHIHTETHINVSGLWCWILGWWATEAEWVWAITSCVCIIDALSGVQRSSLPHYSSQSKKNKPPPPKHSPAWNLLNEQPLCCWAMVGNQLRWRMGSKLVAYQWKPCTLLDFDVSQPVMMRWMELYHCWYAIKHHSGK